MHSDSCRPVVFDMSFMSLAVHRSLGVDADRRGWQLKGVTGGIFRGVYGAMAWEISRRFVPNFGDKSIIFYLL